MSTKQEGSGYEDSYQKEERLKNELLSKLDEVNEFFSVAQRDFDKVDDSFEVFRSINEQIDELEKLEDSLRAELKKMELEYNNIPENDDLKISLEEKIDAQREKITETWNKKSSLREELLKIIEERPGVKGDLSGTMSIIKMKIREIEDIKRQLEELDK